MGLPVSYAARNLLARPTRVLMTCGVTGLTVLAVMLVSSLIGGIQGALMQTADPRNVVVLRKGADNESSSWLPLDAFQIVRALDGVAHAPDGSPLASAELIMQPFALTKRGDQENVLARGVEPVALAVHDQVRISSGRMFRPGTEEAIVGRGAAARYAHALPGSTLRLGGRAYKVVGVFEARGSSFESEVWVDQHLLAASARRVMPYSAIYLRVADPARRDALSRAIEGDKRLALSVRSEESYYEKRAETANVLYAILVLIALLAGTSAVFGATNTQHAAVHARVPEIGTLRALGFSRGAVVRSLLVESLLTGLLGFACGAAGAWLIAWTLTHATGGVGIPTSTFTTLIVGLHIGPRDLTLPVLLAALIGLFGGLLPAVKASRLRPIDALRRH